MKNFGKILGAVAVVLAVASCAKEGFNPIDIKTETTEYTVQGGSQVTITYTIAELAGAEVKAEYSCTDTTVALENKIEGENGTLVATAPDAFAESECKIYLKIIDEANARTAEKTFTLTITKNGRSDGSAANCFVAAPGELLLISGYKGCGTSEYVDCDSVALLWQDNPKLLSSVKKAGPKLVEGYGVIVKFNDNQEGNAVIVALKGGKVQWSWHFWVLKDNIGTVSVQDTTSKVTYTLMDRNIGAINVSEFNAGSIGTVYQWGRKDAYAGQDYNNGFKVMYGMTEADTVSRNQELCTVVNNIANSIANPMTVYYQVYSKTSKGNYSWLTTDYSQWNADELKNLWSLNGIKSKYDPCPDGYMVAPKEAFDAVKTQLKAAKMLMDDSYVVDPSISSKWSEKYRAQNEVKVKFRGGLFGDAYFMVTGDISHTFNCSNGISQLQPSAESWSSTLDDFVSYSSASYFRAFAIKVNASIPSTSTKPEEDIYMSVNSNNGLNLAYELPVRCIKK